MKSIGFRDIAGGGINVYFNTKNPKQKRWDRFYEGLKELEHTGRIVIYRTNGDKVKRLKVKSW